MAGSIGDMIMQLMGKKDPKQMIIDDAMARRGPTEPPPAPPTISADGTPVPAEPKPTVMSGPLPESMKSPPDLAEMYMKLIERSQNAAALDRGLTTIAAAFAQPQNQQALLQMAASYGGGASGGIKMDDIIKMREAAAAEQQLANRQAQLPALMKQYNLDPATVQYLDSTDALDEVVTALANPDTEVVEAADKSKKLINSKTGNTIKELSPKAPRETEFVELGDKSKVLVYKDDKTRVDNGKAVTGIGPQKDIQVIQDTSGANLAYDRNSGKTLGKITEGDPNKGDWTLERADGSSARYNSKNELIKELSPAKVERSIIKAADDSNVLVENGKVVGTITEGDPHKGDFTVTRADGSAARFNTDGKVISELSPAKVDRVFRDGPDGSTVMIEDGVVKGTVIEGDPRKGDYTVEGSDGSRLRYDKNNNLVKTLTGPKVLNAEDKDKLADINKERAAAGQKPMTVEEFQTAFKKTGTSINIDNNGVKYSDPEKGYDWDRNPDGTVKVYPDGAHQHVIPGTKQAEEAVKTEEGADIKEERQVGQYAVTGEDTGRAINFIEEHKDDFISPTGRGAYFAPLYGSDASQLATFLDTVRSNISFDKLQAMRASNPNGAALGSVSDFENRLLQATEGSLKQGQDPDELIYNLKRADKLANAYVYGYKDPKTGKLRHIESQADVDDLLKDIPKPDSTKTTAERDAEPEEDGGYVIKKKGEK